MTDMLWLKCTYHTYYFMQSKKEIRGQVFRNPNFKKIMNQQLEIDK